MVGGLKVENVLVKVVVDFLCLVFFEVELVFEV